MVLDGAMGTMIQSYKLSEEQYRGIYVSIQIFLYDNIIIVDKYTAYKYIMFISSVFVLIHYLIHSVQLMV